MNKGEATITLRRQLASFYGTIYGGSENPVTRGMYTTKMNAILGTTDFVEIAKIWFREFSENEGNVFHGYVAGLSALISDYDDPFVEDGREDETDQWNELLD